MDLKGRIVHRKMPELFFSYQPEGELEAELE